MAGKFAGTIHQIGREIESRVEPEVSAVILAGSEWAAASSNSEEIALWVKGAMQRMDEQVAEATREEIMLACGYKCIRMNPRPLQAAKARRAKFASEEAFLEAEIKKPPRGFRFERHGDILVQFYTPRAYGSGIRCYCGVVQGLPEGVNASRTYCHCSRGFVQKYWEGILGRPVAVELKETAISGAEECRFLIHLGDQSYAT